MGEGGEHRPIGIWQAPWGKLVWIRRKLIAGRNHRNVWAPVGLHRIDAGGYKRCNNRGIRGGPGRSNDGAWPYIFAGGADMRFCGRFGDGDPARQLRRPGRDGGVFYWDDEQASGITHRRTGHDANGLAGGNCLGGCTGGDIACDRQRPRARARNISGADEESIHGGISKRRDGKTRGGILR